MTTLAAKLAALSKATDDGRLIPQQAYILHKAGTYWTTDGKLCASVPSDSDLPPFCVRADLFRALASRDNPQIAMAGASNDRVVVKYAPRGRGTLASIDDESFPLFMNDSDAPLITLEPGFYKTLELLAPWRGDGTISPWKSCIHFRGTFAVAADAAEVAVVHHAEPGVFTLSPWLVNFVLSNKEPPSYLGAGPYITTLKWIESGLCLDARNVDDEVPPALLDMVSAIPQGGDAIPDGTLAAVKRMRDYGAKYVVILATGLRTAVEGNEVFEELDMPFGDERLSWDIERLLKVLRHAATVRFSGEDRISWSSEDGSFRGLLMGART